MIDYENFERHLRSSNLSENTITSYLFAVTQFSAQYSSVTQKNLRAYKAWLIDSYKPQTVNLRLRAINCYLESIGKEKWKQPFVRVQQKAFLENVISEADYEYFKTCLKRDDELFWYFVIRFLTATGARVSELIQIKAEHVRLGHLDIYSKGGKLRRIYIPKSLQDEALSWLDEKRQESGFIFLNRFGERITTRGISAQLKKLAERYSIDTTVVYMQMKKNGRLIRTQIYGEGLSDRMVRACHTRCLTALDRAVADGLIRFNPAADCKLPGQALKDMNLLTREEMQRFLIQAKEEGYYELFLLELATGLRRGEVLALQWDDLDFDTGELCIQRQVYRANGELVVSAPKTKAALRTIVLPPALAGVLADYRQQIDSRWMFPSPAKEDSPLDPATVRKRLQTILKHAGCRKVRFHDLRHLFVTTALENGMDVKTLSTIIGHVSAKTTLNVYTHVTDAMQQTAAAKIDQGIGKCGPQNGLGSAGEGTPAKTSKARSVATFEPYKGKIRKPGTGCVTQINDHLWEGKFSPKWPDGKKRSRSVYAGTEAECEEKLAELIQQMKAEIMEAKHLAAGGKWKAAMALATQKKARGTRKIELLS